MLNLVVGIALFAHQYGVTCAKCHSVIPHLNGFGAAFLANGERFPGISSGPAIPLATKVNVVDSSEYQGGGPNGRGLPKFIVDEVEAFTSATIGSRANFFAEQYLVDGGEPGNLRDAWVADRINPWDSRIPLQAQGGQFTLSLPVDPETFRDTYQEYAPYVQRVGANPFELFDAQPGVRLSAGNPLRGFNLQLFGGAGTEMYAQQAMGALALSFFRYSGSHALGAGLLDRFTRTGYGITYGQWTRFSSEAVLINGWDSNCGLPLSPFDRLRVTGVGCASSGGFEQIRYAFDRRLFAEARYEGTQDSGGTFTRDGVVLFGYGPSENARVTVEDVIAHSPATSNTMNAQFTIAY
jgi:hypothetical protein